MRKSISVQETNLDGELDKLYERGIKNGAKIEIIGEKKFHEIVPNGITSQVELYGARNSNSIPKKFKNLEFNLVNQGVEFLKGTYPLRF